MAERATDKASHVMAERTNHDDAQAEPDWCIYVHDGDPSRLGILPAGASGETILRISEGWRDQERAAKFAAWVSELEARLVAAETRAAQAEQALTEARQYLLIPCSCPEEDIGGEWARVDSATCLAHGDDEHRFAARLDAVLARGGGQQDTG